MQVREVKLDQKGDVCRKTRRKLRVGRRESSNGRRGWSVPAGEMEGGRGGSGSGAGSGAGSGSGSGSGVGAGVPETADSYASAKPSAASPQSPTISVPTISDNDRKLLEIAKYKRGFRSAEIPKIKFRKTY